MTLSGDAQLCFERIRLVGQAFTDGRPLYDVRIWSKKEEDDSELCFVAADRRGSWLVKRGYFQLSRAYRMVARLPFGLKGREAERIAKAAYDGRALDDPKEHLHSSLSDADCADEFLRIYAGYAGAPWCLELSIGTWDLFRKAGGTTVR